MKMSKKLISLLLVLVLSLSMSVSALAQTQSRDDIIESLGLQNVSSSTIGFATDYNSLASLINGKVDNIIILNNIQMLDTLTIDYDVVFATPASGVSLFAAYGAKHFDVTGGDVTIGVERYNGGRVYLDGDCIGDGDYLGGGIDTDAQSLTVDGLEIIQVYGNGITVYDDGDLTLTGATSISNNSGYGVFSDSWDPTINISDERVSICSNFSGGVYIHSGTVTMTAGVISGNYGSGIEAYYGDVYMSGGYIAGNNASYYQGGGGGVSIGFGGMYMSGGYIIGNTAREGGGIYVMASRGTRLEITGGYITENYALTYGGGIRDDDLFSVSGATITYNTAGESGGGIFAGYKLRINNSTVSHNSARVDGGGIYIGMPDYLDPDDIGNYVIFENNSPNDLNI